MSSFADFSGSHLAVSSALALRYDKQGLKNTDRTGKGVILVVNKGPYYQVITYITVINRYTIIIDIASFLLYIFSHISSPEQIVTDFISAGKGSRKIHFGKMNHFHSVLLMVSELEQSMSYVSWNKYSQS